MKKFIHNLAVRSKSKINDDYFVLGVGNYRPLPPMLPGQFVEIKVEKNVDVFLRRPISVHDVDYEKNILYLLIKVVGEGTKTLKSITIQDTLNLVYPLGNSFNTDDVQNVLLAGGGCGIAPMLYLARHLKEKNITTSILLGGRTASDILRYDSFLEYGEVFVSTDDGSKGEKGFITNNKVMENLTSFDRVYCCGPLPMLKVFAKITTEKGVDCEVSLENTMACGIGACLCCVTETVAGNKCVCTEGPVFNIKQLAWQI